MSKSRVAMGVVVMALGGLIVAGCNSGGMTAEEAKQMQTKPGAMPAGAMDGVAQMRAEYAKRHPNQNNLAPGQAPVGIPAAKQ